MDFNLMNLVAKLTLDSSEYEKGLNGASESAGGFGSKLGAAAKGATALVAGGAAVVTAIGGAVVKGSTEVAEFGDHIDKNSQKMGISAEAYQEWDAILQHSGSSIDSMQRGMITLSKAAEKGDDSFEKLGITQEELQSLNQEELFARTIEGLQNMESGTERTALASKLLGGSAKELGALLNTSAEDTEKMRQTVHDLGGVMSDDAVKAAAAYQDSLQDMNTAIDGAKRGIVSNFLPSITSVMDGITGLFSGDSSAIGKIEDGIDSFIKNLTGMIPKVIEKGTQIVMALLNAIITNLPAIIKAGFQAILQLAKGISDALPQLIPAAIDAVMEIVDGLIENIDLLVDAALQLMIGLAEGLIEALPKIIEKIPTIIEKLYKAFTDAIPKIAEAGVKLLTSLVKNLPAIIDAIIKALPEIIKNILSGIANHWSAIATAGVKLFSALVTNLGEAIKIIVGKIPQVLSAIVDGFKKGFSDMVDVGKQLLEGIGKGIVNAVRSVVQKAKDAAQSILDAVKGFFGIASPSKEFAKVGGFLMSGMAKGIDDNLGMVEGAMGDLQDTIDTNTPDMSFNAEGNAGAIRMIDGMTFNIYGAEGQDVNALADAVADRFQTLVDMRAAVWA